MDSDQQTTTKKVKKHVTKHLILVLLILFPPAAWYFMWKENKYHNWFASVLIVDGLIFIATSILLLAAVFPPFTRLFNALEVAQPLSAKVIPFLFIAVGLLEIAYGLFLRIKTHHIGILPNKLLIVVIFLLSVHFIGLPLGQIYAYFDNLRTLSEVKLQSNNTNPTSPTSSWKTYENNSLNISFEYPSNWTYDQFEDSKGIILKPKGVKKYEEKYSGVLQVGTGGFGQDKVSSYENWIKTKANQEIQGLGTINTITPITTESGATGYRVVWNMLPGTPSNNKTLTIYYFQLPNSTTSSGIEITLNDPMFEEIANQTIKTFQFTNTKYQNSATVTKTPLTPTTSPTTTPAQQSNTPNNSNTSSNPNSPTSTPPTQDTTPPVMDIMTGPENGSTVDINNFCFPMHVTDNVSHEPDLQVRFKFDTSTFGDWGTNYAPCYNNVANGQHEFNVEVRDKAGNSISITRTFTVQAP